MQPPGLDTVVVIDVIQAADRTKLILGGLDIARLVHRAGLQDHLLAVPVDVEVKARQGLRLHVARKPRLLPVPAAVERDVDAGDLAVARPGEAGDDHRSRPVIDRRLRRGRGDDRFRVHQPGPLARPAIRHQVGVFRGLLAAFDGLIVDPDPAQPLDPHVAFEARHDEAHGVAVFLPQRLAIGEEGHHHVVHRLFQRHRAAVRRGIGALGIDPFALGLHARLGKDVAQHHAGIFHVVDHALGELAALELRAAPFHAAIGRAFAEGGHDVARKPGDILVGEDQRPLDQPVDHQPVVLFRQFDRARVVTLEGAALRGDRAFERVDRREVDRGDRALGQPFDIAAHHRGFEVDRHAVGRRVDRVAEGGRPVLHLGDERVGRALGAGDPRRGDASTCGQSRPQHGASAGPLAFGLAH